MDKKTVLVLNVEHHLKRMGWSQKELAKRLGKSKDYVSTLKRAKHINLEVAGKLMDVFDLNSLDELFLVAKVDDKNKEK